VAPLMPELFDDGDEGKFTEGLFVVLFNIFGEIY
jgi:hypothetical protein